MALQVALSIIDSSGGPVPPLGLPTVATYTVWLSGSAKIWTGKAPTGTVAGICPQPAWSSALQVAPLNTATCVVVRVRYVEACRSAGRSRRARISVGIGFPTVSVGHGPSHRETSSAWQWRSSITETVLPPSALPFALKPFVTYSVCVAGSAAGEVRAVADRCGGDQRRPEAERPRRRVQAGLHGLIGENPRPAGSADPKTLRSPVQTPIARSRRPMRRVSARACPRRTRACWRTQPRRRGRGKTEGQREQEDLDSVHIKAPYGSVISSVLIDVESLS